MNTKQLFEKRRDRVRLALRKRAQGRVRLSVFRSNRNIYAQLIDDVRGVTLVAASTKDAELDKKFNNKTHIDAAKEVGRLVAIRAAKAKIDTVVFDRGGYMYHGRIKALADSARENGLKF